ncbi:BCCT family transporter [Desulforhopalus singaporensis]|uniref:Glycine betaine transporter n=1 Tax=Desulforhopalus singaporensis TaxID=91360 RepID=A0A1H0KCX1_9BACT|nr:BCCT family transporter [Desulforhopalus singaporensis]SDO53683.1 glycine betaine transporter [Desulforhopalus singaporensis]
MDSSNITAIESKDVDVSPDTLITRIFGKYDRAIFWPVLLSFATVIVLALAYPDATAKTLVTIRNFLIFNFSWAFLLGVGLTLLFCIYLAVSPFGDLKLGKDEDKPEFSFWTWVAMLFSCGLGIGFVFYSVAEPLTHLHQSSHVIDAGTAGTAAGVPKAIEMTLLDWGIHGWALFALAAWAIAFPAYRLGKPLTVATGLYGLLGDRCNSSILGRLADGLGALGTIGGNAAMIGLGVASISYGIETLFGVHLSDPGKAGVMILLIFAYVISAATGIERGIRYLSQINMVLAGGVVLFLLLFGHAPAQYLFNMMTQMCGDYFNGILKYSFWSDAGNFQQRDWLGWWIVFYWLWWISYIPFCGGFIARISKGRTLRQFMFGVILVPMLLAILWFSVWGGSAAYAELNGIVPLWSNVQANPESGVYSLLGSMPLGWIISVVVLFNIIIFAITTSDSASFFVAMQMSKGQANPKVSMRLLWGFVIGMTGIIFQLTGGFNAIKSLAIVVGAPFFLVGIAFIFSVYAMLKKAKQGRM